MGATTRQTAAVCKTSRAEYINLEAILPLAG